MSDNEERRDCTCGRSAKKVHCPNCGSYVVVGYAKREVVNRGGGVIERIRAYRCRRCSEIFNDDKWQKECHAPSPQLGRPRKATIDRLFELASLERPATLAEQAAVLRMFNEGKLTNPSPALRKPQDERKRQ